MNKNDLKLISSFIDIKNPKVELNFAHLKDDGIYATDTRKWIKFCVPMLGLNLLLEKRILNGFVSTLGKDDFVSIDGSGFIRTGFNRTGSVKMSCDTFSYDEVKPVDFDRIMNIQFDNHFFLKSIEDLQFELAQRNCFIDEEHLNPIISFAECTGFYISYNQQKETIEDDVKTKHNGIVKIVGKHFTENESNLVKFVAIVMGRTFESKAIEE